MCRADHPLRGAQLSDCVCVCACVCVCVCVCVCELLYTTVTVYTCSEEVEEIRLSNEGKRKHRKIYWFLRDFW